MEQTDLKQKLPFDAGFGFFGLIVGLLIAYLLTPIFELIPYHSISLTFIVLEYIFSCWFCVQVFGSRGREMHERMMQPFKSAQSQKNELSDRDAEYGSKILDTSVIIDGRIADLMEEGFIEGKIIIPDFVLVELRHIADSNDDAKRLRGRRGLDILKRIQTDQSIEIFDTSADEEPSGGDVESRLIDLARSLNGKLVTNNEVVIKSAQILGVETLNMNKLASTLKPYVAPGEEMILSLVGEGKEAGQALAYMDDGTMIVVEDGRKLVGSTATAVVTNVMQTKSGRMIFTKLKPSPLPV